MYHPASSSGFTLIELSIVLVIIGLIVSGILVGQDLIKNAEVRAQISQIEKYDQAVNTFKAKFNAIPGDMAVSVANQFGFSVGVACNGQQGGRDGNGLIDGFVGTAIYLQTSGENNLFWEDLSSGPSGGLIDGTFPNSGAYPEGCGTSLNMNTTPGTSYIGDYFPLAKIGHGNFVYVFEAGGYNWYSISALTSVAIGGGVFTSSTNIPVIQAYNIDKKVDDGLPTTGAVQTQYITGSNTVLSVSPNATTDTATTCYNTISNAYSVSSLADYGAGGNCALSFRFQ